MANNYYYLIAGLTDYSFDEDMAKIDAVGLRSEIIAEVAPVDVAYIDMLYLFYDIKNLITYLSDNTRPLNPLGMLSADDLAEEMERTRESQNNSAFPKWVEELLFSYRKMPRDDDESPERTLDELQTELLSQYYRLASKSKCAFIRRWADFDRTVRNITAATVARSAGIDIAPNLIGDGEIEKALVRSGAADFGLKGEVDYIDTLIQILDTDDMYERELKLDNLYWTMSEELTEFDYFTTDKLLAYLVKVNILHRWASLDKSRGSEILRSMIDALTSVDLFEETEKNNKI